MRERDSERGHWNFLGQPLLGSLGQKFSMSLGSLFTASPGGQTFCISMLCLTVLCFENRMACSEATDKERLWKLWGISVIITLIKINVWDLIEQVLTEDSSSIYIIAVTCLLVSLFDFALTPSISIQLLEVISGLEMALKTSSLRVFRRGPILCQV